MVKGKQNPAVSSLNIQRINYYHKRFLNLVSFLEASYETLWVTTKYTFFSLPLQSR